VVNRAGELGLQQPGGISRDHLRAAMGRTRGTDIYGTLNTLNRKFHCFDKNGNGRIEHGDIAGIVDENLECIPGWVRNRFGISREAAIQQGTAILENDFGVKRR
jgi:Ca2+-binding EF-hand superfamily protein